MATTNTARGALLFDLSPYTSNHGAQPRGRRGSWAFSFDGPDLWGGDPRLFFAHGNLTFGQAKKLAAAEGKRRGATTAWLLP